MFQPIAGAGSETQSASTTPAQHGLLYSRANEGGKNTAVIGGATLGSVLFAVLLGIDLHFYRTRRRSEVEQPSATQSHGGDVEAQGTTRCSCLREDTHHFAFIDPTNLNQATPLEHLSPKTANSIPSQQNTPSPAAPSPWKGMVYTPTPGVAPPYP
ncbi:hypothetical protein BDV98DRAFT_575870 [Pterulicium gracile]|uniref:Uncharacterized protein n=1 Tax=Pterulicium gracile TaxID=1884261 RepID=A0A5C3Q381_9AGAR|nr:hypothetical protein BDV98DRAFT_575870 [Pterula gracilis]